MALLLILQKVTLPYEPEFLTTLLAASGSPASKKFKPALLNTVRRVLMPLATSSLFVVLVVVVVIVIVIVAVVWLLLLLFAGCFPRRDGAAGRSNGSQLQGPSVYAGINGRLARLCASLSLACFLASLLPCLLTCLLCFALGESTDASITARVWWYAFAGASERWPALNGTLKLVALPNDAFRFNLLVLLALSVRAIAACSLPVVVVVVVVVVVCCCCG